jgi:Flp pilus assembly protein TadG
MMHLLSGLVRAARDARGVAASELAVLLPVLVLIFFSAYDFSNATAITLRLEGAARSGAQYAFANPTDTSGIIQKVQAGLNGMSNVTIPTPAMVCKCDNGAAVDCSTGSCLLAGVTLSPLAYVSVTATRPYQFLSPASAVLYPNLATLRGNVTIRLH